MTLARPSALLAALALTLAVPATAGAATQAIDDGDDAVAEGFYGKQVDPRRVEITQEGGQTTVSVTLEAPSTQPGAENDHVALFADSNADGKSDFGLAFSG